MELGIWKGKGRQDVPTDNDFDANKALEELREKKSLLRKGRFNRSRLDRYTFEILSLQKNGATASEIHMWLKEHRVRITYTTVTRWLKKHVSMVVCETANAS